jgi:hypothetical protein
MRKRLGIAVGLMALTFVLSSCWVMQSFVIGDYTLTPGQTTKAKLTLRPMGSDYALTGYRQFLMIGVSSIAIGEDTDIGVSGARWGVNGQFGGPLPMGIENGIATSLAPGECAQSGLDFTDVTGHLWKAFATTTNRNDQGKVESKSVMEVILKAKAAEVNVGENYSIVAVAGAWHDDGDGTPEDAASTDDSYICWGIATASVHARAA